MSDQQNLEESEFDDDSSWLVTYGDIITLLLIFFVVMFSASKVNHDRFEKLAQSINESLNRPVQQGKEAVGQGAAVRNPLPDVEKLVKKLIAARNLKGQMSTELQSDGIKLELSSSSFFSSGSAVVKPAMQQTLAGLSRIIASLPIAAYTVEIEGHTDDVPIKTASFPSNWELSALRAINVLHLFERAGLDPAMMSATGFAETRPKVPNIGAGGVASPKNRAINRRIVVFIRHAE